MFAFLVVRAHFITSAEGDLAHAHLKLSRASLCELLAIKMLRHFAKNPIELVAVLTVSWHPIAGAPPAVKEAVKRLVGGHEEDLDHPASAIEVSQTFVGWLESPLICFRWQLPLKANTSWLPLLHRRSLTIYTPEEWCTPSLRQGRSLQITTSSGKSKYMILKLHPSWIITGEPFPRATGV